MKIDMKGKPGLSNTAGNKSRNQAVKVVVVGGGGDQFFFLSVAQTAPQQKQLYPTEVSVYCRSSAGSIMDFR